MTVNTVSLGTPYRWLGEAFAACRAHTRVLLGAASLLVLVSLLPSLLQLLIEAALQPSLPARLVLQAVFLLIGLVLLPPVTGGFYRLLHALDQGQAATPGDVFAVFRDGATARRLIVTNLLFVLATIVVVVGLALAFGGTALVDYLRALSALQPGATTLPAFPSGLFSLLSVLAILAMVITTAQQLAAVQVALSERTPLAAAGDGLLVALRNIGAWLLFYLPLAVLGFVAMVVVALVVGLVGVMLSAVSPTMAGIVLVPVFLLLMLVMYALLFSFYYRAWRDTLGAGTLPATSDHQIAA
jgi:hypothetical protein